MKRLVIVVLFFCGLISTAQVGIGTTTPLSTLDINGNLSVKHVSLPVVPGATAAQTIDDGVYISIFPNVNNQIFTLPNPVTYPGRIYILRNIRDVNVDARIRTAGTGTQFFAGNNSTAGTNFVTLDGDNTQNKTLIFISDGSNWTYGTLSF